MTKVEKEVHAEPGPPLTEAKRKISDFITSTLVFACFVFNVLNFRIQGDSSGQTLEFVDVDLRIPPYWLAAIPIEFCPISSCISRIGQKVGQPNQNQPSKGADQTNQPVEYELIWNFEFPNSRREVGSCDSF